MFRAALQCSLRWRRRRDNPSKPQMVGHTGRQACRKREYVSIPHPAALEKNGQTLVFSKPSAVGWFRKSRLWAVCDCFWSQDRPFQVHCKYPYYRQQWLAFTFLASKRILVAWAPLGSVCWAGAQANSTAGILWHLETVIIHLELILKYP